MKLIYLTSKTYPADMADKVYAREMSGAFSRLLGDNFLLVVANNFSQELDNIRYLNLRLKLKKVRSLFYFFWIPCFTIFKQNFGKNLIYFSNDSYLLAILIFWRKILQFKYKICSDWHLLFNDWRDGFIIKNSDYLITTFKKLKKFLSDFDKINPDKILVVYGGVDLKNFEINLSKEEIRRKLSLPLKDKLIGYVGFFKSVSKKKGLGMMIKSLQFLKDRDDIKMVFVGGKKDEIREYKSLTKKMRVLNQCIFFGIKPLNEIALFEKAMDILVIPYPNLPHFVKYGFPMKTYGYMASKRPIIYSKLPPAREVLSDCAFSFVPDNPEDLAKIINYVLKNSKLAKEKTLLAFNKVQNFTWEKKAKEILDFIKA